MVKVPHNRASLLELGSSSSLQIGWNTNASIYSYSGILLLGTQTAADVFLRVNGATVLSATTRGTAQIAPLASDPGTPSDGDVWVTTAGDLKWRGNGTTKSAGTGSSLTVTPEAYGAAGDGVTDDKAAIQSAIDAVETAGSGRVVFGAKVYHMTGPVTIDPTKAVALVGEGIESTILDSDTTCFRIEQQDADAVATTTATADIAFRATAITVTSSTGFAVGQLLRVTSTENMEETSRTIPKEFVTEVKSVDSGTQITVRHPCPIEFTASGNTINVFGFATAPISMNDMSLLGVEVLPATQLGLARLLNAADVTFTDVRFKEANEADLLNPAFDGSDPLLYGVYANKCARIIADRCRFEFLAYGFLAQDGSANCEIRHSTAKSCRHLNNWGDGAHGVARHLLDHVRLLRWLRQPPGRHRLDVRRLPRIRQHRGHETARPPRRGAQLLFLRFRVRGRPRCSLGLRLHDGVGTDA